jgi:hypothetical protein
MRRKKMRKRVFTALGLLLLDASVFAVTTVFLPRARSWGHSGRWSYFVNSRTRWDLAWGTLVAMLLLSTGAFLILEAFGAFERKRKTIEPSPGGDA